MNCIHHSSGNTYIPTAGKLSVPCRLPPHRRYSAETTTFSFTPGPRPERPEIAAQYEAEMPEFSLRLQAKAGLTGYAQVYGRYKTPSYNKLKLDMIYIEHYSIWLDIKLLFLTFKIIFIKDNSEGFDEKTAEEMQERMLGAMQENTQEKTGEE